MNVSMLVHFPGLAVRVMVVHFRRGNVVAVHLGDLEMSMAVAHVGAVLSPSE